MRLESYKHIGDSFIDMDKLTVNNNFLNNYLFEGEMLDILIFPDPVLKMKSKKVTEFNEELMTLAKNMLYTMYQTPGIGLAAPQVGKNIRMFVIDIGYSREKITGFDGEERYEYDDFSPHVFINPTITKPEGEILYEEGCLSLPGVFEEVKRAQKVQVDYFDLNGDKQSLEVEDTLAVCVQHEFDHLEGVVFIDRISLIKRNLIKKKFLKR